MSENKSLLTHWYTTDHFKFRVLPAVLLLTPYTMAINYAKEYFRVLNLCLSHQTHKV